MAIRRSSVIVGVIGLVLIIGAVTVRFVVVPAVSKLPSNTNLSITYSGTGTLLDSDALKSGDTAHVLAANIPITVDRHIKVTSTHGNTAVVSDDITLKAGSTTLPNDHVYAVNRKTLNATTPPKGATVDPASGLTVAFPLSPRANNSYRYYDSASQLTVPVKHEGKGKRGGRSVYHYTATAAGTVKDKNLVGVLPNALPKATLASLAPLLPDALRAQVAPALPSLPSTVPLNYTVTSSIDAWVDTQTGLPLDEGITQQVVAGLTVGGQQVKLIPVLAIKAQLLPKSVKYLAGKASSAGKQLTIIKVVVPIVLLIVGLVLVVVAVLRRQRRDQQRTPVREKVTSG
jgi:hypothetical protein